MIIGLAGGIGVGKSFVANCFLKNFNASIFDADSIVHKLYKANKKIINYAKIKFPEGVVKGKINKNTLSQYFLTYDKNWKQFESLVHFAVQNELETFILKKENNNKKLLILDIPLLLETKFHLYCNTIIFIHADNTVQIQRINKRNNINKKKLNLILDIQLPTIKKRQMSNFIIDNNHNKETVISQIKNILNSLNFNS